MYIILIILIITILYIDIYYYHHRFKEGVRTQNVSLHFEGTLRTLPTKTTPGGRSATNFTFKEGSQKM